MIKYLFSFSKNMISKPSLISSRLILIVLILGSLLLASYFVPTAIAQNSIEDTFGRIETPPGVEEYQSEVAGDEIAIIRFISRMIRVATIIAGIWIVFNFVLAGYHYIFSMGEASAHTKVKDALTMSVLGLALIIASYTVAGVIGLLIFGDPGFILNPTIEGPFK